GYSAHGRVGTARRQGPDRPTTAGRRPEARMVRALRDGDEENARRGLTSNLIDGGGDPVRSMSEALRLSALALFAVGPVVAVPALLLRRLTPSPTWSRITGWRRYVPATLLPVEWLLPPALIALRVGEVEADWLPVRAAGLAAGLAGAAVLVWSAALLGRLFMH